MATRKTSKASSRQQAPESEGPAVNVLSNGHSSTSVYNGQSAPGIAAATNGSSPTFEQIQRRAYELFLARGGTHGCDLEDWLTAEEELSGTAAATH
jgi:Protein of unknown function (DUF2934)